MAKHEDRLILVTGATGHQGGAAIRHLQQKNFAVRAVTRDPNQPKARSLVGHGTEVVSADLENPEALTRVLDGVYGVYSVQNYADGAETEIRQGINLADAAKRSRISQFVYSSVGSAHKNTGIPHFESKFRIEEHVRGTGLPFSILRPVFFMENWLGMKSGIDAGTLALPLRPETRLQMIAVDDIGAFVALAFEHPGKWNGRALDIAGDELSMTELADAFGRMSGREIRYLQVPWDQFEKQTGPEMTTMYKWFQEVGYDIDIPAIRREYPRLTSFEKWLQTNWRVAATAAG
ncbi:MAG: NmrA/HSCARG family protein [Acidobacteriota bacterium]|nr:NmrA/HSCARG family protein [Acidobacteriota bacterium]